MARVLNMTNLDSLQVGSAATSVAAATASMVTPHPLQILTWCVAIAAGLYSIWRGIHADYLRERKDDNNAD